MIFIAYLHNAFILSTVHNAQTATPPPSKHRSVGWAKRKRGKDNGLLDSDSDRDPLKKKLKMDVMSLSKADRDRLKALVKVNIYIPCVCALKLQDLLTLQIYICI